MANCNDPIQIICCGSSAEKNQTYKEAGLLKESGLLLFTVLCNFSGSDRVSRSPVPQPA